MKKVIILLIVVIILASFASTGSALESGRYQLNTAGSIPFVIDTQTGRVWKFFLDTQGDESYPSFGFQPVGFQVGENKWQYVPQ